MSSNPFAGQFEEFIHLSRYARWREEDGRRETWRETVDRYVDYMCNVKCAGKIPDEVREEIRKGIFELKVMPSMRCMMTAGKALERDEVAGFNCSFLAIDDVVAFDELLYILMCLAPDTMVKTRNGNKPICEITMEDEVVSFNETTSQYEYIRPSLVAETPSSEKRKIELELENGSVVRVTEDHKFLTTNRGWVEARDLTDEDDIRNYHEVL